LEEKNMLRVLALSLVICCTLYLSASAVQNAGPTWNDVCAQYSFYSYPMSTVTTFGDAYYGSNFAKDMAEITARLNQLMATKIPPPVLDDMLNYTLESWPDPLH
jgi:hypothetical protein